MEVGFSQKTVTGKHPRFSASNIKISGNDKKQRCLKE
jgi:hypothetical protein